MRTCDLGERTEVDGETPGSRISLDVRDRVNFKNVNRIHSIYPGAGGPTPHSHTKFCLTLQYITNRTL